MGTYGPAVSPAHDGITTGSVTVTTPTSTALVWQVPTGDSTYIAVNAKNGASLPNFTIQGGNEALTWRQEYPGVEAIYVILLDPSTGLAAVGATALLLVSVEAQLAALADAAEALRQSVATGQLVTEQLTETEQQIQDLYSRINDGGGGGGGSAGYIEYWNADTSSYEPAPASFTFSVGPNAPTPVPGNYQGLWFETS